MSTKNHEGLRASDCKTGHWVKIDGEKWQVVGPHPDPSTFWVQRYVGDKYETQAIRVRDLDANR